MATPHPAQEHDDAEALTAAVREGRADTENGRTIPYEDVRRWLLSWGTENELPPPKCRESSHEPQ